MNQETIEDIFKRVQENIATMAEVIEFESAHDASVLLANGHLALVGISEITTRIAIGFTRAYSDAPEPS